MTMLFLFDQDSYSGPNYSNIDTPFSLVDACLFSQLVDLKDRLGETDPMMSSKSYSQLWTDLRRCVDRCHRDGVIKLQVAADPSRYTTVVVEDYRSASR